MQSVSNLLIVNTFKVANNEDYKQKKGIKIWIFHLQ